MILERAQRWWLLRTQNGDSYFSFTRSLPLHVLVVTLVSHTQWRWLPFFYSFTIVARSHCNPSVEHAMVMTTLHTQWQWLPFFYSFAIFARSCCNPSVEHTMAMITLHTQQQWLPLFYLFDSFARICFNLSFAHAMAMATPPLLVRFLSFVATRCRCHFRTRSLPSHVLVVIASSFARTRCNLSFVHAMAMTTSLLLVHFLSFVVDATWGHVRFLRTYLL